MKKFIVALIILGIIVGLRLREEQAEPGPAIRESVKPIEESAATEVVKTPAIEKRNEQSLEDPVRRIQGLLANEKWQSALDAVQEELRKDPKSVFYLETAGMLQLTKLET